MNYQHELYYIFLLEIHQLFDYIKKNVKIKELIKIFQFNYIFYDFE